MKIRCRFLVRIFDILLLSAVLMGIQAFVVPGIVYAQQTLPKLDDEHLKK